MKFHKTEFARQLLVVVLGTLFFVATVTFVSLPMSLKCGTDSDNACVASATTGHLT
ncbi:MAG: hypothetical protein PVF40_06585 [Ectothiorhodospiraceae bacterium]|jgi:hypothetical protein